MRTAQTIRRDNTTFVLLSFEGPDPYARVGKLGERVTNLAETLAQMGFETHLLFVGDPAAPGHEMSIRGKLHLHRWCQWISRYHPGGAYHGEDDKLWDFNGSAPSFVVQQIVRRSAFNGKLVVVQGEEWHSAEAICQIADLSQVEALADRVLTLWNANDVHSFGRIDWPRLARSASITTLSKYMKHLMWELGINPLVIPNGIPRRLLNKVDERKVSLIRKAFEGDLLLVKITDWEPAKRWRSAIQAIARLKARGRKPALIAAGNCRDDDARQHQAEVIRAAHSFGLNVVDVAWPPGGLDEQISALARDAGADVLHLKCPLSEELVRILYAAGVGVLADSDHEAFGQQSLEVMAAGGVAFTGCTGEDYADPLVNAIVLESDSPDEIADYAQYLYDRPDEIERIRQSGRATAHRHTWDEVVANLIEKIDYLHRTGAGERRGLIQVPSLTWTTRLPVSSSTIRRLYQRQGISQPSPRTT